jgi:hypothetical protein
MHRPYWTSHAIRNISTTLHTKYAGNHSLPACIVFDRLLQLPHRTTQGSDGRIEVYTPEFSNSAMETSVHSLSSKQLAVLLANRTHLSLW